MEKTPKIFIAAIALVVGVLAGFWFGASQSYQRGYDKAVADTQETQQELARKAGEEAARAANPFQAENPLQGVSANPFDDAIENLNPFAD